MIRTEDLRRQHGELLDIVTEMSALLNEDALKEEAGPIRSLLSKFAAKLSTHLKMEDIKLYPVLIDNADEKVRSVANDFMEEMGGLKDAFGKYLDNWPTVPKIQKDPAGFVTQTKGIFEALGKRIEREDNQLYKIFDNLKA
ncbi:MAG: hemerythrin domain-containing protein [Thermodesulfobacteriota bacterium]